MTTKPKEIPFGATAKNVADDVPIMASEGEYVLPANVVKFLGIEKIQKMVDKAKAALEAMGEIVGDNETDELVEDNELPFDSSELEAVPHLAEGGEVQDTGLSFPQNNGYTGAKEYRDEAGNSMFIPWVNGSPLYPPPTGYAESVEPAKGDDPKSTANKAASSIKDPFPLMDNSAKENGQFVEANRSNLSRNPDQWSVDDFIDFGRNRDSLGNNAVKGIISMLPGGKLAMKARDKWLDHDVSKQFDAMLETGKDMQGNLLTPEQRQQLVSTRENLKTDLSKESGISFSPMESLANAVQRFTSFTGGGGQLTPRSDLSTSATPSQKGYTYSGGDQKLGSNLTNKSDNQYSGSTLGGAGNKDGSASQSAVDNAKSGSGGLYAEGGLVTRRKNKTK